MKQRHHIQLTILQKLLFAPQLSYTELKPDLTLENNQFSFHLDQLKKDGLVEKNVDMYRLTPQGKEYAGRLDTDNSKFMVQAKIGARVACTRLREGQLEFLVYTRKKQPFYGCQGFLSGKVRYGETVSDAAKRELKEETNLTGNPTLVEVQHMLVYEEDSHTLLEDKFFFFYRVHEPEGELLPNNEGEHYWIPENRLEQEVTNPFEDKTNFMREIYTLKNFAGQLSFREQIFTSQKF